MQTRLGLSGPEATLPAGIPWGTPGIHRVKGQVGDLVFRVSPMPVSEYGQALLLQEAEPVLGSTVAGALQTAFPLGVAWLDRASDQALLVNQAFWDVWRLPPGRDPESSSRLRSACRGFVLDALAFEAAWPDSSAGAGRFEDVALTDGRTIRLATFDVSSGHRWVIVEDVTERKLQREAAHENEIRNRESQRLESLSVLAGGIAHDFNNLLLVILANAELLREDTDLPPGVESAVSDIRVAAERASELSAKMLAYSGRGHMVHARTPIIEVVERVVQELREEGVRATMAVTGVSGRPLVMGDPDQLHQLFKAILINAQESAGVQRISIQHAVDNWTTESLSQLYLGDRLVSGPYVSVSIADDGEGIDKAALTRIFDPFFSTRGPSRGLGLAAAAGITRGHGGTIDVSSTRGAGAKVRVLLPVLQALARPTSSPSALPRPVLEATILLVDDESLVRRSARQALEQAGFQVVEAETGELAFEMFAQQPDRFQLVIMDISMPGVQGDLVAREMRTLTVKPVPLVLSSGYRPKLDLGPDGVADRFLQKPYRRAELVQTARELLARHTSTEPSDD